MHSFSIIFIGKTWVELQIPTQPPSQLQQIPPPTPTPNITRRQAMSIDLMSLRFTITKDQNKLAEYKWSGNGSSEWNPVWVKVPRRSVQRAEQL